MPHALRRIVILPEHLQQLVEGCDGRIEHDQHHLGVSGHPRAHFPVGGVLRIAARVPDSGGIHAGRLPELAFGAPEAAHPEHRLLEARWKRRHQGMAVHEVRVRNRHDGVTARQRLLGTRKTKAGCTAEERHNFLSVADV